MAEESKQKIIHCIETLIKNNLETVSVKKKDNELENVEKPHLENKCSIQNQNIYTCNCHEQQSKLVLILESKLDMFSKISKDLDIFYKIDEQGCDELISNCLCYNGTRFLFSTVRCNDDKEWQFVTVCLKILLALFEVSQSEEYLSNHRKLDQEKHGPNFLGVYDEKAIVALVQMITALGICPNLLPGVGLPMQDTVDTSFFLSKNQVYPQKLFSIVYVFLTVIKNKSLGRIIIPSLCSDLIASLIQLGVKKTKRSPERCCCTSQNGFCVNCNQLCFHEKTWCLNELDNFVTCAYQPLIVKELLKLQRGGVGEVKLKNRWFQKIIGQLLSRCLMQKNGVQAVIQGILEGCDSGIQYIYIDFTHKKLMYIFSYCTTD